MDVEMYDRALERTSGLVRGLTPEELSAQTPCTDWTVRDVLSHMVENSAAVVSGVSGEQPSASAGGDPAAAFESVGKEVGAVLAQPGALEKTYDMPWGETPGQMLLGLALADTVIHGWDIAAALGRPYEVDEEIVETVHAMTTSMLEPNGSMPRGPSFAPPVEVPADAPVMDRVVGYMGRDPKAAAAN